MGKVHGEGEDLGKVQVYILDAFDSQFVWPPGFLLAHTYRALLDMDMKDGLLRELDLGTAHLTLQNLVLTNL
jgi:hypothetical protein